MYRVLYQKKDMLCKKIRIVVAFKKVFCLRNLCTKLPDVLVTINACAHKMCAQKVKPIRPWVSRFGTFWHHEAPCGTIWCQNVIPFLAPYSAKTEPVLATYGAKNGITFWHHMVFFGLQFLIIFWAIATYINTIHLQSIRKYQTN